MSHERKLILDTETTGLNYNEDKIIEIGIVELIDNVLTSNFFHVYINPQRTISSSAQKVHGLTNQFLENKPIFSEISEQLLNFIKNDILIIHNAEFDTTFINKELENCGFKSMNNKIIDTIQIAKKEFPGQTVNLDSLCRKLNVINTRKDFHGALLDANLLSKVYLNLTTGKQEKLKLDLRNEKITKQRNLNQNYIDKFNEPRKQLMLLSENEKKYHENFINEIKDPIWKKIK